MSGNKGLLAQMAALQQPEEDTGIGSLKYALARQQADDDARAAYVRNAAQFRFGSINGLTGNLENPGTGEIMQDYNGNVLNSRAALANQAQTVNANKGFEPGQQTPDQIQADTMTKLSKSIMGLPEEDRHLAYERAIGLMAGKGVIEMNQAPPWDKGGRELTQHIAELKVQGDLGVAQLNAQGLIGAAQAQAQGTVQAAQAKAYTNPLDAQKTQAEVNKLNAETKAMGNGNTKLNAALARSDATIFKEAQDSFDVANAIKANLDSVKAANNAASSGLPGRVFSNTAAQLGLSSDTSNANRQIEQASNTLALQMKSLYKMTGAMSDADRAFLQNMVPRAEDTPAARANAVENISKYTDYVSSRASALQNYIKQQGTSAGFNTEWDKMHPGGVRGFITGAAQTPTAITPQTYGLTTAQWNQILALRTQQQRPTPKGLMPGDILDY